MEKRMNIFKRLMRFLFWSRKQTEQAEELSFKFTVVPLDAETKKAFHAQTKTGRKVSSGVKANEGAAPIVSIESRRSKVQRGKTSGVKTKSSKVDSTN